MSSTRSARTTRRRPQPLFAAMPAERWFRPQFEALEKRYVLAAAVVGRTLFYDNSSFDGNVPGPSANDQLAIATDKSAYLPNGVTATFAAVSSYTRGINGIMVDIAGSGNHTAITAADFAFKISDEVLPNSNYPESWSPAPAPAQLQVSIGGGISGSDRVTITWATGAIVNKWLEVLVAPTGNTGLDSTDVFFWGSRVGDANGNFSTTNGDAGLALNNPGQASVANLFDFDRNGSVTNGDAGQALSNPGGLARTAVALAAPALTTALANDTGPGGFPNADGITTDDTISGTLTGTAPLVSFTVRVDGGTTFPFSIPPSSNFTITPAQLDALHGSPLADGPHQVRISAQDAQGLATVRDVSFTLKRSIAAPGLPDLVVASDSGTFSTDNITNDNTPTINVTAELGSVVFLYVNGSPVASQTANPIAQFTTPLLADGLRSITARAMDGAGNISLESPILAVTVDTAAPVVDMSTLVTFTDDLTPHVTVTTTGATNGTSAVLDVDVNNDGDFNDSQETGRTLATLFANSAYFQINPALPATNPGVGAYLVQLRGRVTDLAGNQGVSPLRSLLIDSLGNNVLANYVNAADASFSVGASPASIIPSDDTANPAFKVYVYDLKSQTWRSSAEVNQPLWQHWLQIIVPAVVTKSTAFLYINGGSTSATPPTTLSGDMTALGQLAVLEQMITVNLPNVPNQPLHFNDEPEGVTRTEDRIISYTFDKFVDGAAGSDTWLALLPMVKSAVKAMTAVQMRDTSIPGGVDVQDFIVSGGSKRGWTTWLTGAVDTRVKAIAPAVIDLLNMDESMVHHYGFYGAFAEAIDDYQDFDLIQNSLVPANQEIGRIVDPYHYLFNSNLTNIPKMLLNSAGDEFFVPDSAQYYYSDIPGPKYLRYFPNTGHGLDNGKTDSLVNFTHSVLNNRPIPEYSWSIDPDGAIRVQTVTAPIQVKLWTAENLAARDFRNSIGGQLTGIHYDPTVLSSSGGGVYVANVAAPPSGARAFLIELTFPAPDPGYPNWVFTTEVRVVRAANNPLHAWNFFMPTNGGGGGGAGSGAPLGMPNEDRDALAFALTTTGTAIAAAGPPLSSVPGDDAPAQYPPADDDDDLLDWQWDGELPAIEHADTPAAIDAVLAELTAELAL